MAERCAVYLCKLGARRGPLCGDHEREFRQHPLGAEDMAPAGRRRWLKLKRAAIQDAMAVRKQRARASAAALPATW